MSQENCFAVLGVDPRRYLDRVVPLCRGHVVSLGKLRLTPVDVAEEKLRELTTIQGDTERFGSERDDDEDQPRSIDDVLRAVGRERTSSSER